MSMQELPLSKVYRLIEPGPVVLVCTRDAGRPNLMTMSYLMVVSDAEPLLGVNIGPWNHSHAALRATGECVLAVPAADLAETVVRIGNCSGEDLDKFAAFGLTPLPAAEVGPPLVAECLANLECRIVDDRLADPYNLFIVQVVRAWSDPARAERRLIHHNGNGTFVLDGETLDLTALMTKWPSFLD